jgi:glyoxylase-like metal-dependent hydrolase (beta-lactamase superfamily II)
MIMLLSRTALSTGRKSEGDHAGARRAPRWLRRRRGQRGDVARQPGFYRPSSLRPSGIRFLAHSALAGGARYRPVVSLETLTKDQTLDLPGRPRVIHTPGHTAGHYSVVLSERGVLLSGDALATFDYVTGKHGIGLHRLNDDRAIALASLDRLESVDAQVILPAHGDPWTGATARALDIAREGL